MNGDSAHFCAVCGAPAASHSSPEAEQASGPPDLDLRPGGQAAADLAGWVQRCPACGYCHTDLAELPAGDAADAAAIAAVTGSAAYRRLLADERYPATANSFRCLALLQSSFQPSTALAGLSLLYAAWVCDDAAAAAGPLHPSQAASLARALRRDSAQTLRAALEAGQLYLDDAATCWLVLADIYRRAEQFPSAHTATVRGLAVAGDAAGLVALLELEQQLVEGLQTGPASVALLFTEAAEPGTL